ncbi:MAG TPA: ribonuclease D, partial [Halothiobacillaceae bacterium]|nr:ribonuclease D [Halothiobacillaceae bacterium]
MPAEQKLPAPDQVPRQWVGAPPELAELDAAINQAQLVALDTEFIRERTYFPKLALLQCCIDQQPSAYLLDPTTLNLTNFWSTLVSSDATVAIHAGSQDLELILQQAGTLPENLFDTQ